jgi:WD40 repeat protein
MITCVVFAADGKTVASGSSDGTAKLWDVATGKERATLKADSGEVSSLAFHPDGKVLATAGEEEVVKLWDIASGKELAVLKGHTNAVHCVAYSPDGKTLASGSEDETVRLWDPITGKVKTILKGHLDGVWDVVFSPDGKVLATGSGDGTIKLWDVATGKERATLKGHAGDVYSLSFAPDGKTIASASEDETLRVWDVTRGRESTVFHPDQGWILATAFSRDGKMLASSGGDGTVKLWDAATGRGLARYQAHDGEVDALAFAPDGKTLASGGRDELVKLWDIVRGEAKDAPVVKRDYSAVKPVPRKDITWVHRHESFRERAKQGNVEVVFLGDSITKGWEGDGAEVWKKEFAPLKAVNFGINGDRTQHVLWRLQEGKELQDLQPKVIVLLIGTNNTGSNSAEEIAEGVAAVVRELRRQCPRTKILLLGLFPRRPAATNPVREKIREVNKRVAKLGDANKVHNLDIGEKFLEMDGTLSKEIMPDYLHLSAKGYQIYAEAIRTPLNDLLKK